MKYGLVETGKKQTFINFNLIASKHCEKELLAKARKEIVKDKEVLLNFIITKHIKDYITQYPAPITKTRSGSYLPPPF